VPEPVPPWYNVVPSAPAKANYFYVAESEEGENEAEAKDKAWVKAKEHAKEYGAVDVGTPDRAIKCVAVLEITQNKSKVYVLVKAQNNDTWGKSGGVHEVPDKKVERLCKDSKFEAEKKRYNADIARRDSIFQAEKKNLLMIEAVMTDVNREISGAKDLFTAGRNKDALEIAVQSKKRLESPPLPYYGDLQLDAVKRERIGSNLSRLRREIDSLIIIWKAPTSVFVDGREAADGVKTAGVAEKLKTRLIQNGHDVVNNRASATYHLNFETTACNVARSPYIDMVTCQICAKAQVTNLTTGRSEGGVDFTSKKEVGDDQNAACGKAAESVADELWNRLKSDVSVFSK